MTITKNTFFFITLLFVLNYANAQSVKKFYDYNWKECKMSNARYYSATSKSDTGYYRRVYFLREKKLQMIGNYKDSLCEIKDGIFTFFHINGAIKSTGKYVQNKKTGLWLIFYDNGFKSDSSVYLNGKLIGTSLAWYKNGLKQDSTSLNDDRSGTFFSWFSNGTLASTGSYTQGMEKDGKWKYYYKNGTLSEIATYEKSKFITRQYYSENGEALSDTTNTDSFAEFPGGEKKWLKYLAENLEFPNEYEIVNGEQATTVVSFIINEEGIVEDVFTSSSFDPRMDILAEKVIKASPKWKPGISHNRKVKVSYWQPVTFFNFPK